MNLTLRYGALPKAGSVTRNKVAMNDTPVNTGFREQAARWLVQAQAEAGITDAQIIRDAGIAKTTFYGLKQGERDPDQATLDAIAKAIGIGAPRIERVLLGGEIVLQTPVAMVRDARAILDRLERLLVARPDAGNAELVKAQSHLKVAEALERPYAPGAKQPRKKSG